MDVTRERAWETLTRYTESEALRRHALADGAAITMGRTRAVYRSGER